MRVALVLGSSTGGVRQHVGDLAAGLISAGHDVLVAAPASVLDRMRLTPQLRTVAVEVTDRPRPSDLTAVARLARIRRGADVVHAHGLRAAALVALTAGTAPLVATLHNAPPEGRGTARVYAALERLVALRAALVLGVSQDLVARAERLGARSSRLAVVPAPPPPIGTRPAAQTRAALDLPAGSSLVVTVARLAPQKDLGLLLDAAGLQRGAQPPMLWVVAGDGPQRDALQRRITAERLPVRLLGHRGDVADLLAAADVVVSTARWEGQPVALQEALHLGAALVATDAGGTAAVLGGAGRLVPVGDAPALAAAVGEIVGDPHVAARLREQARARAAALPDRRAAVEAALAAYRSVRGDTPGR